QHARHDLVDDDSLPLHQGREQVLHDGDPVLHVHDRNVRVRAWLEIDHDRCLTGTGGAGGHVTHVLDAVDGSLQKNKRRVDQNFGTGAGISNEDHHGRRRDGGELRFRQGYDSQPPQEQGDSRDNDRQSRSMEDFCEHGSEIISLGSVPGSGCYSACFFWSARTTSGLLSSYSTFSPSRTCRTPSRTILSFPSSPLLMTKMS